MRKRTVFDSAWRQTQGDPGGLQRSASASETAPCPGCGRPVRQDATRCLFCGRAMAPGELDSAPEASEHVAAAPVPSAAPAPPVDDAAAPPARRCPSCGGPTEATIRLDHWKHTGYTITSKEKYRVHTWQAPGPCAACKGAFVGKRMAATALAVLPMIAFALVAATASTFGGLLALFFYGIYLLKWGDYAWSDELVYGGNLAGALVAFIPPELSQGNQRFPVSLLHYFGRIGLAAVVSFVAFVAGSALGGRP